ncbi:MAG: tRNA pseudouridine(55) synthase TruB [Rhodospirillales bacterium]|jgi:tRNA pseudouridine55 synthase|nr:tRNA pseudouridine(55) synthase TruB [Rhodospirillales bacterium]MBT4005540.1 tRNA pseudouridine(55) synthase TruB [Rhodospirillales bacterium]MBT5076288.1 tRNA pseudouridine(55) synthase TruB [Rhodospirillales bacterium]MBT5112259.1 tRNA pseudouridine(55) synthase TruB [Rhodospirillales bacterium]MBT5671960.1 tRNA pseudouridine(55) synthase TruB [Rhodospirillales bacterium]
MGRRRKPPVGARPLNGWVIVDKPIGISSAGVVSRLRAALKPMRIGHGGTLDPLASGVLPVALGEATKTVSYIMDGTKTYHFTILFGESRDTGDGEGKVTETSTVRPETAAIEAILGQFIGVIEQVPPKYSAIKINGKRAYDLARLGEAVEIPSRMVEIKALTLISRPDPDHVALELVCGKGTYVRSLAQDLAVALGSVGHVAELRRTQVGPFGINAAIGLDNLCTLGHSARDFEYLHPIETVLDDIPALALTGDEAAAMRQGQSVKVFGTRDNDPTTLSDGAVVCAMDGTKLVALARICSGEVHPVRVLNL